MKNLRPLATLALLAPVIVVVCYMFATLAPVVGL